MNKKEYKQKITERIIKEHSEFVALQKHYCRELNKLVNPEDYVIPPVTTKGKSGVKELKKTQNGLKKYAK